jgi:hypothetical protein
MARTPDTVDLPVTLHLSKQAKDAVSRRAAASGADLEEYVSRLVERSALAEFSLEELSGPVYQRFLQSGGNDDELSDELERGKHELRAERRARRS